MSNTLRRSTAPRHRSSLLLLLLLAVAAGLAAAQSLRAQPPPPPAPPSVVRTRRNVATLSTTQVAAFRQGVKVMKSRPATDPTSWTYQANIHGTFDTPTKTAWSSCQHGSFFFLSWHRMYLYFFERILRKASGDPNLTLPYWNYSDPTQRALPLIFRSPASSTNSLFTSQRAPGINTGSQLPSSAVSFANAFSFTNFSSPSGSGLSFGGPTRTTPAHGGSPAGALENTPHGPVHVLVGGSSGLMSAFETAARDPIFWLHHANIDRLWNRWLQQGGGRKNPTDTVWLNTKFTFFNENGQPVQMTGAQVVKTASQLGYRYDDDPPTFLLAPAVPVGPSLTDAAERPREVMFAAQANLELGAAKTRMEMAVPENLKEKMATVLAEDSQVQLSLDLEDISVDKQPGVYYEVYINLPADEANPDPQSAHYVGNLSFFGFGAHGTHAAPEHEGGPIFHLELSGAARTLKDEGSWQGGQVSLTLVPRGLLSATGKAPATITVGGKVKIGKVSVSTH